VLLTALIIFFIGTILASAANSISILLVGRSIQGVGGGGLVALTYVVIADMVTLRERGKWFSIIALQWAVGSVIGPVIGGLLAEHASWRWIFLINIPFCVIAGVGIPICLRLHAKEGSIWVKIRAFDWLGSFIFVAAATSFLIPLTWVSISLTHALVTLCADNMARQVSCILGLRGECSYPSYLVYLDWLASSFTLSISRQNHLSAAASSTPLQRLWHTSGPWFKV
jgi:MFS family permease